MTTEIRQRRNSGAEAIPWDTLQDERLTSTAIGVLARCLSLPDGWKYSAERLANASAQGKQATLKALKELEMLGYRRLVTERDESGQFKSYSEFSHFPIPEWAEEAKKRSETPRKKPGPKAMSQGAKRAANDDRKPKPQVEPEVKKPESGKEDSGPPGKTDVSAGRTGSQETGIRFPGSLRGVYREVDTHTGNSTVDSAPAEVTEPERVCVDESIDSTAATDQVLQTVALEVRSLLSQADRNRVDAVVRECLAAGHSISAITKRVTGRTNANTCAPRAVLVKALRQLQGESPAVSRTSGTPGASCASVGVSARSQKVLCPDCGESISEVGATCAACVSEALAAGGAR